LDAPGLVSGETPVCVWSWPNIGQSSVGAVGPLSAGTPVSAGDPVCLAGGEATLPEPTTITRPVTADDVVAALVWASASALVARCAAGAAPNASKPAPAMATAPHRVPRLRCIVFPPLRWWDVIARCCC
jgi:hypothetical protein